MFATQDETPYNFMLTYSSDVYWIEQRFIPPSMEFSDSMFIYTWETSDGATFGYLKSAIDIELDLTWNRVATGVEDS
jgi:hypothetical protein